MCFVLRALWFFVVYKFCNSELRCYAKVAVPLVNLGEDMKPNEFPYVGVIITLKEEKRGFCTGTLITENLVLTAAHCLRMKIQRCEMKQPDSISFHIGNVRLNKRGHVIRADYAIQVEQIYWHEEYTGEKPWVRTHDIGLLKLKEPLITITPATLYKSMSLANIKLCFAVGGGRNRSGLHQRRIQKVPMPVRNQKECLLMSSKPYDTTYQLCAKDPSCSDGHCPDTCPGDSGSPLICPSRLNSKSFSQLAVYSRGSRPCGDTRPSVFVKIAPFVDWLNQHAKNASKPIKWNFF